MRVDERSGQTTRNLPDCRRIFEGGIRALPLKVAVQMDPIARINIRGDSTFALLLEAQKRGHSPVVLHAGPNLAAWRATGSARAETDCAGQGRRSLLAWRAGTRGPGFLRCDFAAGRIRRSISPTSRRRIFWSASTTRALIVNNPASVRNAPEKIFVMGFADLMPPTLISRDKDEINSFRAEHGDVVMKPL